MPEIPILHVLYPHRRRRYVSNLSLAVIVRGPIACRVVRSWAPSGSTIRQGHRTPEIGRTMSLTLTLLLLSLLNAYGRSGLIVVGTAALSVPVRMDAGRAHGGARPHR